MAAGMNRHQRASVGDRVRLLHPVRTLPVGPGDAGIVTAVLGGTGGRALIAVRVTASPLPVVVFEDEVEPAP